VFAGDFELAAAEAVVAADDLDRFEVADSLFKLVEKSLVVAHADLQTTRYGFLETIRDYSSERLVQSGESDPVAERHCRHYVSLARDLAPGLCGRQELEARAAIERELDNLRVALRWAIDAGQADTALRLIDSLWNVGAIRSPFGTLPLAAARMEGANGHPFAPVALASAAAAFSAQGDNVKARELFDAAVAAALAAKDSAGGKRALCHTFVNTAMVGHALSDVSKFLEMGRTWLEAARELDDQFEISQALNITGSLVADADAGIEQCELALAIARELGSPSRIAYSAISLAGRLVHVDVDRAEEVLSEALAAARVARNDWVDAFAATNLALLQAQRGDLAGSARSLVDAAERRGRAGDHFAASTAITYLAVVLAAMGDEAALLLGAWSEHRMADIATSPVFAELGHAYQAMQEAQCDEDRRLRLEQTASLDVLEIISIARLHIDQMADTT
jgi:hypothetical protein